MMPFYVIAQVTAAASQMAAAQAAERRRLGLPEPVIPPRTAEQIKQDRRDDRMAGAIFALYFLLGAVVFVAPPVMLIYCVLKFAFAAQGVKFP